MSIDLTAARDAAIHALLCSYPDGATAAHALTPVPQENGTFTSVAALTVDTTLAAAAPLIEAAVREQILRDLLANFEDQHRLTHLTQEEDGYAGLDWQAWNDGTRNGMERLTYTVRYLLQHPDHPIHAARIVREGGPK